MKTKPYDAVIDQLNRLLDLKHRYEREGRQDKALEVESIIRDHSDISPRDTASQLLALNELVHVKYEQDN